MEIVKSVKTIPPAKLRTPPEFDGGRLKSAITRGCMLKDRHPAQKLDTQSQVIKLLPPGFREAHAFA
jgi:hypothetical protein